MDTTKEYIKMCEKAVEVQGVKGEYTDDSSIEYHACKKHLRVLPLDQEGCYFCPECRSFPDVLWLPRQDQLQEMCFDGYVVNAGNVKIFADWCFEVADPDGIYPKMLRWSIEACWLAFVMHEKYNKIWDGEGWKRE